MPSIPSLSFTYRVGATSEINIEVTSVSLLMPSCSYLRQGQLPVPPFLDLNDLNLFSCLWAVSCY